MRTRFALGAAAMTAALAVGLAGAAVAQSRPLTGGPARAVSASAPAALASAQRSRVTGPHLVSGVVRDVTGHPLGSVCVLAAAVGTSPRIARTSANGRYLLSLPRAGAYTVTYRYCQAGRAADPALAPGATRRIEVGASPVTALPATTLRRVSPASDSAALAAAGVTSPRAGRIIRLRTGGVRAAGGTVPREPGVSGPTAGALTGRVTNQAGRPLAGICVWVLGQGFAEGIPTAKSGTYTFNANQFYPGRYQVLFTSNCDKTINTAGPLAPGSWAPEWYRGKFALSQADRVRLRAHQATRGINAVMRPAARIGGIVTGSDGRRIKNACVVVLAGPNLEVGQAATGSGGGYTVTGLDPGRYRILALPACGDTPSVYGQSWYPRAQSYSTARAVPARLGHLTSGINVVLPELGTISGVIRLSGKTGKRLGGICVDVGSSTELSFGVSHRNGTYSVEGLPAGNYQVQAFAGCGNGGDYAPASYPHPVRVVNGRRTAGIDLSLAPGATLTGTVTDAATGKPLAGICVLYGDENSSNTGADGTYTIAQLPAERTTVSFAGGCGNKGSYAPQYYDDQVPLAAAQPVTVTAGHASTGIDAAMRPGATIAGRVTNAAGQPVRGVCISVSPAPLAGSTTIFFGGSVATNAAGSYTVANLAPGDYRVAFFSGCRGPSNAAAWQWFKGQPTVTAAGLVDAGAGGREAGIDAVVSPGGSIAGGVTSSSGQPVEFSCVTAINRRTGQPSGFQSLTGGDDFTISSLAPGSYTVVASDCGGSNLAAGVHPGPVTVRAGRTTRKVALTLAPGGAVSGRITAVRSGRPVRNACVEATPASAAAARLGTGSGALTGRSGRYKITGLGGGRYRIEIFPGCFGPGANLQAVTLPHSVPVTPGKVAAHVNAALPAGGSIAGQVWGPAGAAVPGACAVAYQIPGGMAGQASAGATGKYVLTGLTPGRYKVEFEGPSCSDGAPGLGLRWYNSPAGHGPATVITVTAGRTVSDVSGKLPADGAISGSVTGTSAAPLTGVCVSAVPLARDEPASFTVSAAGSYTLADLQPGRYRVEFQAGCGQPGVTTQWWRDAVSRATATIVTVGAGATVSGIDAAMTSG